MNESILAYRDRRYLKLGLLVALAALAAYAIHRPLGPANGGTWLGYGLGTLGAVLILWLMAFGLRKRRYGDGGGRLQDWLSAHVYLGLALVLIVTLHTGFQFAWNMHTLAYALMMLVVASGVFGVVTYVRLPRIQTDNLGDHSFDSLIRKIADVDAEARAVAGGLSDEIAAAVVRGIEETRIGGGVLQQLDGGRTAGASRAALERVRSLTTETTSEDHVSIQRLLTLLAVKVELVRKARIDVRFRALLQIWLYVHVPMSFALLAALLAHVVAVLFYR